MSALTIAVREFLAVHNSNSRTLRGYEDALWGVVAALEAEEAGQPAEPAGESVDDVVVEPEAVSEPAPPKTAAKPKATKPEPEPVAAPEPTGEETE